MSFNILVDFVDQILFVMNSKELVSQSRFLIVEIMVHGIGVKLVFHEPWKNFDYVGCFIGFFQFFIMRNVIWLLFKKISSGGENMILSLFTIATLPTPSGHANLTLTFLFCPDAFLCISRLILDSF